MTTLFLLPELFSPEEVRVDGDVHHHLFRVKRLQVGDRLRVVDGEGGARFAVVSAVDRKSARLELGEAAPSNEPSFDVELCVAAPKPERAAWLVEKATEIGVTAIRFLNTERDPRTFGAAQLERLARIAVSAVEQSGRSRVPRIGGMLALDEALRRAREGGAALLVLDAGGRAETWLAPSTGSGATVLFIGPEGGWSDAERAAFVAAGATAVSLGERTLRVETAAVVAAALALAGRSAKEL